MTNKTHHQLLHEDKVFLLDISPDQNHDSSGAAYSESRIHRKIISLFKHRDDFDSIDIRIQTSRGLSERTRVDVSNALLHMRAKGKRLRRFYADIDYMEPSVHDFATMACLWFDEIHILSNPEFEQTSLSVGLAFAIRHALTLNQQCARVLELTCGVSEEASDVLADAMVSANALQRFNLHLLAGRSGHLCSVLEGLQGKSNLKQLCLRDVNADVAESLAVLLGHSNCRIADLELSYAWESTSPYKTEKFCQALTFMETSNKSVRRLVLDGIRFYSSNDDDESASKSSTRVLATAFPLLESLSLAAPTMPSFEDFLDMNPQDLPQNLKACYFPCDVPDVEQARNLVERLPRLSIIPDYQSDPIVQHLLDWRYIMKQQQAPTQANVWPFIFERTNKLLHQHPQRKANMLFTLLQDYHRLQKTGQLVFPVIEDDDDVDSAVHVEEDVAVAANLLMDAFDEANEQGDY